MNDCPSHHELSSFLAGEIFDDPLRLEIETHIETCIECVKTLSEISPSAGTIVTDLQTELSDPFGAEEKCKEALERILAAAVMPPLAGSGDADHETVQPAASEMADLKRLGPYEVIGRLGQGAMGTVYAARHVHLNRAVAIKVLRQIDSRSAILRFQREMKAVGGINHPNIVAASDSGMENNQHFLVMQLIDGIDAARLVQHVESIPVADACEIVRQAAIGLQHIHELGMVHRDIKPGNLMLERTSPSQVRDRRSESECSGDDRNAEADSSINAADDREPVVRILDLGLALLNDQSAVDESQLTQTGQVVGTLDYMAPEQCLDSHRVDIRADIYGLGATLFKLLCGHSPFSGLEYQTFGRKFQAILNEQPPTIAARRSDLPNDLVECVDRLLGKDPETRPRHPIDVANALAPFAEGHRLATLIDDSIDAIEQAGEITDTGWTHGSRLGQSDLSVMTAAELAALRRASDRTTWRYRAVVLAAIGLMAALAWTFLPPRKSPSTDVNLQRASVSDGVSDSQIKSDLPTPPRTAVAPFDSAQAVAFQQEWADWLGATVSQQNQLRMEFCLVPPGEFTMGDDSLTRKTKWGDERIAPAHRVTITRAFVIGNSEVSQSEFREIMGRNPSQSSANDDWPVENITWDDAVKFCNLLSQKEGLPLYYRIGSTSISVIGGAGYRLPTEAEWEFACRAGTTSKYSFGEELPKQPGAKTDAPQPHRSGQPNAFGIYHMHGNVAEFCWDGGSRDLRTASPARDPVGSEDGTQRVVKGGDFEQAVPSAAFDLVYPFRPYFKTGFRVARTLPDPNAGSEPAFAPTTQQLIDKSLTGGGLLPIRLDELATGTWQPLFNSPDVVTSHDFAKWSDGVIEFSARHRGNGHRAISSTPLAKRDMVVRADVRFIDGYSAGIELTGLPGTKIVQAIVKPGQVLLGFKAPQKTYLQCHPNFVPDLSRYVDTALVRKGNEFAVYINGIRRVGTQPGQLESFLHGVDMLTPEIVGDSTVGELSTMFRNVRLMILK